MHPTAATHRDQTSREMRRMHLQELVWDMEELRGVGEPASAARVYFVTFFVFVFPVSWEGRRYKGKFLRRRLVSEVGGILAFGDDGEECVDTEWSLYQLLADGDESVKIDYFKRCENYSEKKQNWRKRKSQIVFFFPFFF